MKQICVRTSMENKCKKSLLLASKGPTILLFKISRRIAHENRKVTLTLIYIVCKRSHFDEL